MHAQLHDQAESKDHLDLTVRAAEALVRIDGGANAWSLLRLADALRVSGDTAKSTEYARRAIEAAAGEPSDFRQDIEEEAQRLGAEK